MFRVKSYITLMEKNVFLSMSNGLYWKVSKGYGNIVMIMFGLCNKMTTSLCQQLGSMSG